MKSVKLLAAIIAIGLFIGLVQPAIAATKLDFPDPVNYVNDFADVLSDKTEEELNERLDAFAKKDSTQILVVTAKKLPDGVSIYDFVPKLTDGNPLWRAGQEKYDNGVFLTIIIDSRDMAIDVGYGLEGALTDIEANNILDDEVAPLLRQSKFDDAVKAGVQSIMNAVQGEYSAKNTTKKSGGNVAGYVFVVAIFLFVFLPYLGAYLARSKTWYAGGIVGGALGLGGAAWSSGSSLLGGLGIWNFIAVPLVFAGLGLLFDYVLSKNYKVRKKKGLPTTWHSSRGGFSSSSSSWFSGSSSSSSSGGFHAGGGSFGGGGSHGKW